MEIPTEIRKTKPLEILRPRKFGKQNLRPHPTEIRKTKPLEILRKPLEEFGKQNPRKLHPVTYPTTWGVYAELKG